MGSHTPQSFHVGSGWEGGRGDGGAPGSVFLLSQIGLGDTRGRISGDIFSVIRVAANPGVDKGWNMLDGHRSEEGGFYN